MPNASVSSLSANTAELPSTTAGFCRHRAALLLNNVTPCVGNSSATGLSCDRHLLFHELQPCLLNICLQARRNLTKKRFYLRKLDVVDASIIGPVPANMIASTYQYCTLGEMRFSFRGCGWGEHHRQIGGLLSATCEVPYSPSHICGEDARISNIQKRAHAHTPC